MFTWGGEGGEAAYTANNQGLAQEAWTNDLCRQ